MMFLHSDPVEKHPEPAAAVDKNEAGKPPNRASSCRVCLKSFKPDDFSKTCFECKYRVCEDCASYSKQDSSEDLVSTFRFMIERHDNDDGNERSAEYMAMQRVSPENVIADLHTAGLDRLEFGCACFRSSAKETFRCKVKCHKQSGTRPCSAAQPRIASPFRRVCSDAEGTRKVEGH